MAPNNRIFSTMLAAVTNNVKSQPLASRASLIICILTFLFPKALLALLGFGSLGPIAGYGAPAFQSAFGTPALFSMFQGAAMGGASAAKVFAAIKGSAVLTALVPLLVRKKGVVGK